MTFVIAILIKTVMLILHIKVKLFLKKADN